MAKYKFKFESILRVKEVLEKKIKEEISRIYSEIEIFKAEQKKIVAEKSKVEEKLAIQTSKVSEYKSMKMYLEHLNDEYKVYQHKIDECLVLLGKKQTELIEKKKEIKGFEILKENDFQNFQIEERRSELKVLNEIAIRNFDAENT